MDRLISDRPIRLFFKIVLLIFVLSICTLSVAFVFVVYSRILGFIGSENRFVRFFMQALTFPSNSSFAPMIAALAGIFPVIVSSVCYRRLTDRTPIELSSDLNQTGYMVFFILFIGAVTSLAALISIEANKDAILGLYGEDNYKSIKLLFTAILSLQAIYFAQIAGLKPK